MNSNLELVKKIRSFVAISIPEELQNKILSFVQQFEKYNSFSKINWIKPKNLHITLRFLGEIDAEQHVQLVEKIAAIINQVKQFAISFTNLEIFPSFNQPLVLALMIKPSEQLTALARMLDQIAVDCGIATEKRPFVAHLTVGRFNSQNIFSMDDNLKLSQEKLPDNMHFTVKEVILYRSEAHQYLPLNRFQLMVNDNG